MAVKRSKRPRSISQSSLLIAIIIFKVALGSFYCLFPLFFLGDLVIFRYQFGDTREFVGSLAANFFLTAAAPPI